MGILEICTIILACAKMFAHYDLSWWQVFAPIWAGYPTIILLWVIFAGAISTWVIND